MKKIEATIVADSIHKGRRITTFMLTYPRFIHSELMTHRVFSRNSASSRAIPFKKMIKDVEEDPFIPIAWQKEHTGMQGTEYFTDLNTIRILEATWKVGADSAVATAKTLNGTKVTKQLCNRLLEPFLWHTTLVTTTEIDNFFELRCPQYLVSRYPSDRPEALEPTEATFKSKKSAAEATGNETYDWTLIDWLMSSQSGAEIHIQALAEAMWDAYRESSPITLKIGEWHIPFGDKVDKNLLIMQHYKLLGEEKRKTTELDLTDICLKISVARAARLSYMTMDGVINYSKDLELYKSLLKNKHLSAFEHCATPAKWHYELTEIKGATHKDKSENIWSGNFRDWIQYRQLIQQNESNK